MTLNNKAHNTEKQKSVFVSIIGKPNAGKSTLLNHIVGEKISIVTPKVQTTRSVITGISTVGDTQIILYDTPGVFTPKKKLEKAMVRCAWSSINSADIVTLIIDNTNKIDAQTLEIISHLENLAIKFVCLLNKMDLKSKYTDENKEILHNCKSLLRIFEISALNGEGVSQLIDFLKDFAREGHWHYDKDDLTNLPIRFLSAEITREELFLNLDQELPYNLTVESESWIEQANGSVKVNQVIIVSRDSYKMIILGKGGNMIKKIGSAARAKISELAGQKIHLFLFVKVRKNWQDNPESYKYLGLKKPQD